ncbi:MAG: ethanolamine ammonia-lyase subunit EutC [Ferruginibacter sp.]|nr:ethanolamine ammonia-lyase subunit EutC [Cytophagales bacterium]
MADHASPPESFLSSQASPTDPWGNLRDFTAARIALGRVGTCVPLAESLAFKLAHANARDAVYSALAKEKLRSDLEPFGLPVLELNSQARTRAEYLQRPDRGRKLAEASREILADYPPAGSGPSDVALILADGLSATAINDHAAPLLAWLVPRLRDRGLHLAPLCVVEGGRVAISDEIGSLLRARLAVILIGERPGLSSPNSLGVYLTYDPQPGRTDEARNCVSNVRPEGLPYRMAAEKVFYLVSEALRRGLSGVALKDETELLDSRKL